MSEQERRDMKLADYPYCNVVFGTVFIEDAIVFTPSLYLQQLQ